MNHLASSLMQVSKEFICNWEFTVAYQAFSNKFWSWNTWKGSLKPFFFFLTLAGGPYWIRNKDPVESGLLSERQHVRICSVIPLCRNTLLSPWHQMSGVAQSTAWSRFFLQFGDGRTLGEVTEERELGTACTSCCKSFSRLLGPTKPSLSLSLHNAVRCDLHWYHGPKLTLLLRISQAEEKESWYEMPVLSPQSELISLWFSGSALAPGQLTGWFTCPETVTGERLVPVEFLPQLETFFVCLFRVQWSQIFYS